MLGLSLRPSGQRLEELGPRVPARVAPDLSAAGPSGTGDASIGAHAQPSQAVPVAPGPGEGAGSTGSGAGQYRQGGSPETSGQSSVALAAQRQAAAEDAARMPPLPEPTQQAMSVAHISSSSAEKEEESSSSL